MEGAAIRLTGSASSIYRVLYQCHLQDTGTSAVMRNGEFCGSRGASRRLEDLRVWVESTTTSVTEADAAPHVARTLTTVMLQALNRGGSRVALAAPPKLLERAWTTLVVPLDAQSGRWQTNCPAGGNIRIDLPEALQFIGEIPLVNTTAVYTDCSMEIAAATISATGRTNLSGTWSATAPTSPIRMTGSIDVNPIGTELLSIDVDAATGVYNGYLGNIPVGAVIDGPFIPYPPASPPVAPPPAGPPGPGAAAFDGRYCGTGFGFFGGEPFSMVIAFGVTGGVITPTWPGTGTGSVTGAGTANFTASLSRTGRPSVVCGFNGPIRGLGAGFEATGNWSCNGLGQTGTGTWNAVWIPPAFIGC